MNTVEQIAEKVEGLPPELQRETLNYIEFLLAKQAQVAERHQWARFSGAQLLAQYSEADAIYDEGQRGDGRELA